MRWVTQARQLPYRADCIGRVLHEQTKAEPSASAAGLLSSTEHHLLMML